MKKYYISYFFAMLFFTPFIYSQQINVQIFGVNKDAVLFQIVGDKINEIDTVVSANSSYKISVKNRHNGIYRLQLDSNHWVNFINDGKDVVLKTDYNNILNNLKIVKSVSNKLYYEFLKLNKAYKTKSELLNIILTNYPKNDKYYTITKSKLLQIQDEYWNFVKITSQVKANSFIARYIKSAQLPIVDISIPVQQRITYLKKHSLDFVDFNDDELIYSDLFTNKSIEYLTYYRNPKLPKALLEQEFIKAVDTLLNKAKVNDLVYQHLTEYLIVGFTKFGFDSIINYIVDNYVIKDNLCLDVKLESTIDNRINQSKKYKVGSVVPNIILPNKDGEKIDLSKIKAEKTLILFYASWCPHCKEIVPKISKLYKEQIGKRMEVLAISIDTSKSDWMNFVKANKLNWINVSDLKGWYGKTAKDYFIYATPTMFLLNKDKRIIAKPTTIGKLRKLF